MRTVAVVPAYDAASTVGDVVSELARSWPEELGHPAVVVVDDGSRDRSGDVAERAGATVVRHARNRGKGAALRTGFEHALSLGAQTAITVDADGQHRASDAVLLATDSAPPGALVLGVRDLVGGGAPRSNRFGNGVSNFFVSWFSGCRLGDTQCGLRRYPIRATLELGCDDDGYAFEAEALLRAVRAGWTIVEIPVGVVYPAPGEGKSHFRLPHDPARIVLRVVRTVTTTRNDR